MGLLEAITGVDPVSVAASGPLADKTAYVGSKLYLDRLKSQGVKEPEKVQAERLRQLGMVRFVQAPKMSQQARNMSVNSPDQTYGDDKGPKTVQIETPSRAIIAHELGHVTNWPGRTEDVNRAPVGAGMTPAESWFLTQNSKLPKQVLDKVKAKSGFMKPGLYQYNDQFATAFPDSDPHEGGSGERKGDLDALRQLMKDAGITKRFGDNITPEMLKRALQNPKVAKDPHAKRLLRSTTPEQIIRINNGLAGLIGSSPVA